MRIGTYPALLAWTLALSDIAAVAQPPAEPLSLWYRQPAKQWVEALPVGNGRLGAMVFGGVAQERLQLNEDTLWAGGPYDPANPNALEALPKVRELIFAGKYREAQNLISQKMMAKPLTQMPYQCVGDLLLDFPDANGVTDYRRDLNLDTAMATVGYTIDGVRYTREVFSSPVDQVIVVRLTADKPGKVAFTRRHEDAAEGVRDGGIAQYSGDERRQRGASGVCRAC
jgi:alpha-L-fucosidase 2